MKRIVILCDGTWPGLGAACAGNVAALARAIRPCAPDGTPQLVLLHGNPGAHGDRDPQAIGPAIDADMHALYRFLVHNLAEGDELFLFGFSRGAYLARSLVGMLRNAWLLRREHDQHIERAYHVYRTVWHADADNATRFREPLARPVRVRFLGVWETVGELGIPLGLYPGFAAERYNFHDTTLSRIVDHACHALAIDERRAVLPPTLWRTRGDRTRTEQAWFSGSHLDLGGGYHEAGLAQLSLRWMAEQASSCGLVLEEELLAIPITQNGESVVHSGLHGARRDTGLMARPIAATNADETLHSSAEQRYLRERRYRPRNLGDYLARDEQIRLPL